VKKNASITAWSKRTGHDSHGQPTYTAQTGLPIRCLLEVKSKRLKVGPREIVSTARAHLAGSVTIAEGDRITIASIVYLVVASDSVPAGTLRHTTLYLA